MSGAPTRTTVLFTGPGGSQQLVVFVKLSYTLAGPGPMVRARRDLPLTFDTESEGPDDRFTVGCTVSETDLWALKPWTDVVVRGQVHAPQGRPTRGMSVGLQVGRRVKWLRVFGDRRVRATASAIEFTEPEPFTTMELSWRRAYGGIDPSVPHEPIDRVVELLRLFSPEDHPGAYPRNPAGRGWVIHDDRQRIDGMLLPNFETPSHLLAPHRLVVGDRRLWTRAPIPAGFGWWPQGWFPRSALIGLEHPEFIGAVEELPELRTGWIEARHLRAPEGDPRFQSGASPGLRFDALSQGEAIALSGLSPEGLIETRLPTSGPEVRIFVEGRELEPELRLSTVELLPELGVANLVWRAHLRPPSRLPFAMPRPGQASYELLSGVDVIVEGERVPNEVIELG